MKTGANIRQRSDGRFEARYVKERDKSGRIIWGYCYGKTYEEAETKRNNVTGKEMKTYREMNLLILGAGGHGREVYEIAANLRVFQKISFLDDNVELKNVIGACRRFETYLDEYPLAIPAVGDDALRRRWMRELRDTGFLIPTFVHSSSAVPASVQIGHGTVVYAGATIGVGSVIGTGCIIDSGALVERDSIVPDWTHVDCGTVFHRQNAETNWNAYSNVSVQGIAST